jgi:serine/threonine protein kinase
MAGGARAITYFRDKWLSKFATCALAGGMSYIYRGTHSETGQAVIVKLMPAPKNRQEALRLQYRFNQEILIARLATNEHLLAAVDHGDIPMRGTNEPRLYLVYPYIENGSLTDLLNRDKPWKTWELPHIADVIVQAAEGLFHLHKCGIVHQDVKPDNFLWKPADAMHNPLRRIHVWLIDFGTAEPERKSKTRDIKGTLKYLAPEQIDGDIKYSIDQYALALLARLLLTGHEPPSAEEHASLLYRTRPTRLNPQRLFEPEIDHVLFKALAPDPDDRFSSVIEFAQALQAAILKQIQRNISASFSNPSLAQSPRPPDSPSPQPLYKTPQQSCQKTRGW